MHASSRTPSRGEYLIFLCVYICMYIYTYAFTQHLHKCSQISMLKSTREHMASGSDACSYDSDAESLAGNNGAKHLLEPPSPSRATVGHKRTEGRISVDVTFFGRACVHARIHICLLCAHTRVCLAQEGWIFP
jgi:hypothetical protein